MATRGRKRLAVLVAVATTVLGVGSYAIAGGGSNRVEAKDMIGYLEAPSVSTVAKGDFEARINERSDTISWKLSYRRLEGSVTQAHIHFGQKDVNGGISVFLCSNLGNGGDAQACPPSPATITGVIEPQDVSPVTGHPSDPTLGARNQGIDTGEFDELVRAIRAGVTYANVHSTKFPGGEIRGQIKSKSGRGD
jgi:CHRD domain